MHRNPVQAYDRHKMNVYNNLKQKNDIYCRLKCARASEGL